ncbi:hypothetical protein LZC95_02250 [Pendulispora brunnea]|uniref:Cytochrome c domain-containing protein n=1 Tax=Pendulispora brunnea TaxID=2905690 RepID=A0ABZ2KEB6_9BACT
MLHRLRFVGFASVLASACAAASQAPSQGNALRNVDVTVVYPLPAAGQEDDLVKPTAAGTNGVLLPRDVFEQGRMPELDERAPLGDEEERWSSLRVLAVRFDPCPRVVLPPAAGTICEPEIRLVFQSLRREGTVVHARDGAIHGFYRLSQAQWAEVVGELRAIRAENATAPEVRLDVHPSLKGQGPRGAYGVRLASILSRYAGEKNLVRVTHFRRLRRAAAPIGDWTFAIRERNAGGAWSDATIATTSVKEESLVTIVGGRWDADITPVPPAANDVTKVFKGQTADARENFRPVVRALNPRIHSSETIDCASCHIAPDVAVFLEREQPVTSFDERFQSRYSLDAAHKSNEEAIGFEHMHMLSYSGTSLSVSHRVANETAAVLELLNGS